jgi:hypothetical protein
MMSVAFTREESAETAAEVELPDRPISPHANLVTASGPEALANAMAEYRAAYNAAHQIEGCNRTSPRAPAMAIGSNPLSSTSHTIDTTVFLSSLNTVDGIVNLSERLVEERRFF